MNLGDTYALLAALCWSSGVILFELSGKVLDSLQINFLKNLVATICFVLVLIITGNIFVSYTVNEYFLLFISAIFGVALGDLFLLGSLRRLGSGLYAIVGTSYILFVFAISFILYEENISITLFIGSTLIIMGIIIRSSYLPDKLNKKVLTQGIIYGLIAQALTAYSVLLVKPLMSTHPIVHIAMIRFSVGLVFNAFYIIFVRGLGTFKYTIVKGFTTPTMISAAIMGTFLAVIFWLLGFKYTLAGRAAVYNQLSTIIITIIAIIIYKEKITLKTIIAVLFAFIGAIIVSLS